MEKVGYIQDTKEWKESEIRVNKEMIEESRNMMDRVILEAMGETA